MGIYASVVIYPDDHERRPRSTTREGGILSPSLHSPTPLNELSFVSTRPRAARTHDLLETARSAVRAFESVGILTPGTSQELKPLATPTFATCRVTEDPPEDLKWINLHVESRLLSSSLAELIFTQTEKEWWAGLNRKPLEHPDQLAMPDLNVSVFSRAIDATGEEDFGLGYVFGWAFVEFSFGDTRLDDEVHRIRNGQHPLFAHLEEVFGCKPTWGIVAG